MLNKIFVTFSIDDGHKLDLKFLELLNKYHLKATFYITKNYERRSLSDQDIQFISQTQEIGCHTLTHPNLTEISEEKARREIVEAKQWLEGLINKEVTTFCYPKGRYNERVIQLVKEAGFKGARTVEEFQIDFPQDVYQLATTLHIYPFPLRKKDCQFYLWGKYLFQPFFRSYWHLIHQHLPIKSWFSWKSLAKAEFNYVQNNGRVFHLWGHSWEIEKYDMWQELEEIFKSIAFNNDYQYVTNSELLITR